MRQAAWEHPKQQRIFALLERLPYPCPDPETEWEKLVKSVLIPTPGHKKSYTEIEWPINTTSIWHFHAEVPRLALFEFPALIIIAVSADTSSHGPRLDCAVEIAPALW